MPYLIDSTLRDGEQSPGVSFTLPVKLRIVELLSLIGINELECGTPAMGATERSDIRAIVRSGTACRLSVWSRALLRDIECASTTNVEIIHIAFPLSDIQLHSMGRTWEWVLDALPELTAYAFTLFPYVSIGAQDASRAPVDRLHTFIKIATLSHANRIRIADTVGIMDPLWVNGLFRELCTTCPVTLFDFHAHNDLGMATANAVTAFRSGAGSLSVTVNGLGERAGNASLEEVLMSMRQLGVSIPYDISYLNELCTYVSEASHRPLPVSKAIVGALAFSHESGIHAAATLKDSSAYQAFDGSVIGRESARIVYGKHTGRAALSALRESAACGGSSLSESELIVYNDNKKS